MLRNKKEKEIIKRVGHTSRKVDGHVEVHVFPVCVEKDT
jgi:hypothetical protein